MKRKSGLHKRVSTIFGDSPLPGGPSSKMAVSENDAADAERVVTPPSDLPTSDVGVNSGTPHDRPSAVRPAGEMIRKAVPKVSVALTEDQEYDASQRRKMFLVIGLAVGLTLVLFFNFYSPGKKVALKAEELSSQVRAVKASEIDWPEPEVWPASIRDPMVFKEDAAKLYALESGIAGPFVLRAIVHKPEGRSMALLGTEILYEGDEIDGWTVKEVLQEVVRLERADGEKLELKMEDR